MYMFNLEVSLFDHLKNDGEISGLQERELALRGGVCTHLRSSSCRCGDWIGSMRISLTVKPLLKVWVLVFKDADFS